MSPVAQLALFFCFGMWAGSIFEVPANSVWFACVLSAAFCWGARWSGLLAFASVIGCSTGGSVAAAEAHECSVRWPRGRISAVLRVHDSPGTAGVTHASVLHTQQECVGTVRVRFDAESGVPAGSRIVVAGRHRGHGIVRVAHFRVLRGNRSPRYVVRGAISNRIHELYGSRAGLVEAVVLGRRDNVDKTLRDEFVKSGLAHLLAISGLHVGVLGGWCVILARLFGARRRAWVWGVALVWLYVASLGFPTPATRAASFMSIFGIARVRQRHPPAGAVLAVALLVVLAIDPAAVTSVGAWLSASAVWGTRAGVEAIGRFRLLGASVGATLATAPITAFAFGTVAPIGIVANLAAVPVTSLAVPGLFVSLVAGKTVAGGAGLAFAVVERVASLGSAVPGGNIVGVPGVAFSIPWIGLLCFVGWLNIKRPAWTCVWRRVFGVAAFSSWCCVALVFAAEPNSSDELELHVLSVGQGDAIAIRTPRGSWILVDAGPRATGFDAGKRVVLPFLRRKGVPRLAAVVVSHGDADHLGGVPAVVEEMSPELVLEPGQPLGTELYLEFLRSIDMVGADWRPGRAGDYFVIDSVRFEVLHPPAQWVSDRMDQNENSVVLRVEYGCFNAILAGDVGLPAESLMTPRVEPADFLKVAHHGSVGSTGQRWLDALRPRVAAISVGKNRFGHPDPTVLRRFEQAGIPLYRTDVGGTVTIRSDGSYLESVQNGATTFSERFLGLLQPWLRSGHRPNNKVSSNERPAKRDRVVMQVCPAK